MVIVYILIVQFIVYIPDHGFSTCKVWALQTGSCKAYIKIGCVKCVNICCPKIKYETLSDYIGPVKIR